LQFEPAVPHLLVWATAGPCGRSCSGRVLVLFLLGIQYRSGCTGGWGWGWGWPPGLPR